MTFFGLIFCVLSMAILIFGETPFLLNVLGFFWGFAILQIFLKLFCWLNSVNPNCASLLYDPWCSEIPLAFNPTFLNINSDFTEIRVSYLIFGNDWNTQSLRYLFGDNAQCFSSFLGSIDFDSGNHWVWYRGCFGNRILCVHLSAFESPFNFRWCLVWLGQALETSCYPLVHHIVWLTFQGRISTYDYLYNLNLGPVAIVFFVV